MIAPTVFAGQRLAVVGLGGSGLPTALALQKVGATIVCWDDGEGARSRAAQEALELTKPEAMRWSELDGLVLSPGIPLTHPEPHVSVVLANRHGVPIFGDIDLFFAQRAADAPDAPVIAITGTNGKSTTTALIAHALHELDVDAAMGGNIGVPVLELPAFAPGRTYVIECSSYQIDLAPGLAPTVGVHLNLSEDHLARHGTMPNYAAVKEKLVTASQHAIVGVDDPWSDAIAERCVKAGKPVTRISVTKSLPDGLCARGSEIMRSQSGEVERLFSLEGVESLRGSHNAQNACAAAASLLALGTEPSALSSALRSFSGLAHRMEPVATWRGMRFVNDSKATNADAAARALSSFDKIHWIVGGQAKSDGIEPLNGLFPQIVKAYLVGEAQERFAATLDGKLEFVRAGTVDVAVQMAADDAAETAAQSATILLSPACASWDQYASFEARGEAFKRAVATWIEAASASV
ncbi:MAG: UDP-N-acetylmuramoyl-L-alanine--D-glutamate ligase [Pseudomonadota bacterium]